MSFEEVTNSTVAAAARFGHLEDIKRLLNEGHPLDGYDNRGWRPIHEAAYGNYTDCLKFLLEHEKVDVNWQCYEGTTPLFIACHNGNEGSARILLEAGANANIADHMDNFPLHEAVKTKKIGVVKCLVHHGANVNCQLYCGTSPLHQSASEGMLDITQYLLESGASLETKEEYNITPIFAAAQFGQADCLEMLLEHAKNQNKKHLVNYPAEDGATPLFLAAQEGSLPCVSVLLRYGADANIMTNNEPRALPLLAALEFGHLEVVSALLPVTNHEYFRDCDCSPWYLVLAHGNGAKKTQMVKLLIEQGVDVNYMHTRDMEDNYTRFPKILRFLPTESMLFLKCISPLTRSAIYEHENMVSTLVHLLIENGARVNGQREYEYPPIIPALEGKKIGLVKVLVEAGASIDLYHPKLQGNFALLLCLHQWKSFNLLLKLGAEVETLFDEAKYFYCLERSKLGYSKDSKFADKQQTGAEAEIDHKLPDLGTDGEADMIEPKLQDHLESDVEGPAEHINHEDGQLAILESISYISFATFLVGARHVMSSSPYKVSLSQVLYKLVYFARNIPFTEHFMTFLDSEQDQADIRSLTDAPRSLAHLSRLSVRRAMGTQKLLKESETRRELHLPKNIWDFIFFSEVSY